MTQLILDRAGCLREPAEFLAPVGARERSLPRLVGFLAAGVAAALAAALVVGLAIVVLAALQIARTRGVGVLQGIDLALNPGAAHRPLLSYWFELAVAGLATYAAALAILGLAMRFYRRPAASFLTIAPRFRWRLVATGFLIGLAAVGAALIAQLLVAHEPLKPPLLQPGEALPARLGYLGLAAACLYLAALAEEIVFRGVLLQLGGAFTRNLPLLLAVNGVIFSLAHFDPDPSSFAIRALMGAGWAWIALRTGGVETTAGVHLANNLIVGLFVMPISFAPKAAENVDLAAVLIEFATVLVCVGAVEVLVRRRDRAAGARVAALDPATESPGG